MTAASVPGVSVREAAADEAAAWSAFVQRSANGTCFHELTFSDLHRHKAGGVRHVWIRSGERAVATITAGEVETPEGRELRSPFSAAFGGFALASGISLRTAIDAVGAFRRWAAAAGYSRIVLQQPPVIYGAGVDEMLDFALRHEGFEIDGVELCLYLETLDRADAALLRNVRRAREAGCTFQPAADLDALWTLLAEVKAERQQPFSLVREDLLNVARVMPGVARGFEVLLAGRRVAALIAYEANSRVTLGLQWGHVSDAQQARPADLLLHETAAAVIASGRRFDLGTTTLSGVPSWGVTQFKEKFGPAAVERRRWVRTLSAGEI